MTTTVITRTWRIHIPDGDTTLWDYFQRHTVIVEYFLPRGQLQPYIEMLSKWPDYGVALFEDKENSPYIILMPQWARLVAIGSHPGTVITRHAKIQRACNPTCSLIIEDDAWPPRKFEVDTPIWVFNQATSTTRTIICKQPCVLKPGARPRLKTWDMKLVLYTVRNDGFSTITVDFVTEEQAQDFRLPDFLDRYRPQEITDDPRYLDSNLVLHGTPSD